MHTKLGAGTLAYKAPELFSRQPFTKASEMYAFGIVAWELATGAVPWADETEASLIFAMVHCKRPQFLTPAQAATFIGALAKRCWAQYAVDRPTFEELKLEFDTMSRVEGGNTERSSPSLKMEKMLRDRLTLLKSTDCMTHIISCPFKESEGVAAAKEIASRYEDSRSEFCYYPNEDCPQSLDVSWLETWMAIAKNAGRTGGKVYVVHRCDGKGQYGCDAKGPGSLDGQAQQGEVEYATEIGCTIQWVGYAANQAISAGGSGRGCGHGCCASSLAATR
jgi:serine/threonine protein kinase